MLIVAEKGKSFANNVTRIGTLLRSLRSNRGTTAKYLHSQFQKQAPGVYEIAQESLQLTEIARTLRVQQKNIVGEEEDDFIYDVNLEGQCMQLKESSECEARAKFRTIDGSCNNLIEPSYGKSNTPLRRILKNNYTDSISEPRKLGKNGKPLPSAKIVSNSTRGLASNEDRLFTSLVFAFGQFLDHDLDHVPIHEASGKSLLLLKSLLFKSGNCCKPEVKICSILGKVVFTYLIEIIIYNTYKCGYYSRVVTIRKWDPLVADTIQERVLMTHLR